MSPDANQSRLDEMPEEEVIDAMERATAFALRLIRSRVWRGLRDGVLPRGRLAEDIVQESFENVLKGSEWAESKPLWLILEGLVRGKVGNLVNSWENRNFTNPEQIDTRQEQGVSFFDELEAHELSPDEIAARSEEQENFTLDLSEALSDRHEEQLIVDAFMAGIEKRREVADHTGLTVDQVTNAQKRLKRFLETEWKKTPSGHH